LGPRYRFASALSTLPNVEHAVRHVCVRAKADLGSAPDAAVLFVSADFADAAADVAAEACDLLGTENLIGCTGESLIGVGREVEGESAVSLWLAALPGVRVSPFRLTFEPTAEGGSLFGWPDDLMDGWPPNPFLLALGEPFSFPAEALLEQMNQQVPPVRVAGGIASGAAAPGEARVICGRQAFEDGAAVLLLAGPLRVRTVVSQGCRPIGKPLIITRAERNIVFELGGRPAFQQLEELFQTLPTRDRDLFNHGLHVGRVVSEYQDRFEYGDFLIRNVLGFDPQSGAIAVNDFLRIGQTVQFHVRDQQTADADLRELLAAARHESSTPAGGLLFSCNGRGTRLFPEPHHDAQSVRQAFGDLPLAGFFAAGELGPISGRNFVHGFTASLVLFEPAPLAPGALGPGTVPGPR
jgi:small ligand-binding sensory domain FIST